MVSVIIPTYNRAATIERSITSVLAQTYQDIEVIIVDDGSTDETKAIVKQMDDPRIVYLRSFKNRGQSNARNVGIRRSRGDYIAFQDSDDVWLPDKLEKQLLLFEKNPETGLVYCMFQYQNGSHIIYPPYELPREDKVGNIYSKMFAGNLIGMPTAIVKRSIVEQAGSMDETLNCLEDFEWFLRITRLCRVDMVEEILVHTYFSNQRVSTNKLEEVKALCQLLLKYKEDIEQYDTAFDDMMWRIREAGKQAGNPEAIERIIGVTLEHYQNIAVMNKRQPLSKKISIIIPCYNSEKYLDECFESLENQSMPMDDLEIILIDDASEDNTWKLITAFEKKYPDSIVKLRLYENSRQGAARNKGLQYAHGDFIMFFDSDDYLLPTACEHQYELAVKHNLDIALFAHMSFTGKWSTAVKQQGDMGTDAYGIYDLNEDGVRWQFLVNQLMPFGCCFKLYRRQLIEQVQSTFAEKVMYEEPKFVFPLVCEANRIGIFDEVISHIRIHSESTMGSFKNNRNRLMEHPKVQLQLLFWLKQYQEKYHSLWKEIEFYFVNSFYMETIIFSVQEHKRLSEYDYEWLRLVVLAEVPNWHDNAYLMYDKRMRTILEHLDISFIRNPNELPNYLQNISHTFVP